MAFDKVQIEIWCTKVKGPIVENQIQTLSIICDTYPTMSETGIKLFSSYMLGG
jgi:hypothetical protein